MSFFFQNYFDFVLIEILFEIIQFYSKYMFIFKCFLPSSADKFPVINENNNKMNIFIIGANFTDLFFVSFDFFQPYLISTVFCSSIEFFQ